MELELGREGRGEEKQETELTYIKNFGLTIRTRWMDEPWRWRGCGLGYSVLLLEEKGGAYLCSPGFSYCTTAQSRAH